MMAQDLSEIQLEGEYVKVGLARSVGEVQGRGGYRMEE